MTPIDAGLALTDVNAPDGDRRQPPAVGDHEYDLSFVAISVAMLGAAAGAVAVFVSPQRFTPGRGPTGRRQRHRRRRRLVSRPVTEIFTNAVETALFAVTAIRRSRVVESIALTSQSRCRAMRTMIRRSLLVAVCLALVTGAAASIDAQPQAVAPRVTSPETVLRPRHRRRLRAAQLHEVHRVRAEARQGVRPDGRPDHRQDGRGPRPADGDHHVAREPQAARALPRTSRGGSRWPRGSPTTRRARSRARARRSCGSTAGCTPPKCSARSSSSRPSISW